MPASDPDPEEILALNRQEYDDADDPYWCLTVYEPFHAGWKFSNIGGAPALDYFARTAALGPGDRALEMCSGLGDTCRYLVERYHCQVTGVEWNAQQYARAQSARAALASDLRARLHYVHVNLLEWRPDSGYRLAYAVDSLMYVEDRAAALRNARQALVPGGWLALAEVVAGPRLDSAVREFVWAEDGILDLPQDNALRASLGLQGFTDVRIEDWTPRADACFATMEQASREHRPALVLAKGEPRYERWLRNAGIYRTAFREQALRYVVVTARKA